MKWARHVARIGCIINAYKILVGKPKGKRPIERSMHRLEDNIKMNLRETGLEGVDWIRLSLDRDLLQTLVNMIINFRAP
jgi:hypothetical protein